MPQATLYDTPTLNMTTRFHPIHLTGILLVVITAISFCTFFRNYSEPSQLLWDEVYYIPSAQKYLNRIFFMNDHPPLGKLLMALGEDIVNANPVDDQLIATGRAKSTPHGLSFAGYRLFPALCAWLSVPLLFLLIFSLTQSPARAFIIGLAYSLQNALIVHLRLAVLDGIQIFCILAALLALSNAYRRAKGNTPIGLAPLFAGIFFSAAVATKITALVVAIGFTPLVLATVRSPRRFAVCALQIALGFIATHYLIWQLHFSLGQHSPPNGSNPPVYAASERYREIVRTGAQNRLSSFPVMFRDSVAHLLRPHSAVPTLNLCRPGEKGSSTWSWPLGGRSIAYSWGKQAAELRPRILQVSPVSWLLALAGLLVACALALGRIFLGTNRDQEPPVWLYTYLAMWIGYMVNMSSLNRTLYLYHYFVPFIFCLVLAALVWSYVRLSPENSSTRRVLPWVNYAALIQAMVCSFLFFAPLTYGSLMTKEEINARSLFSLWDLRCPGCDMTNRFATPLVTQPELNLLGVRIGNLNALGGWQQHGAPKVDQTVRNEPIVVQGVTARNGINTRATSSFAFPINRNYKLFTGKVGIPDFVKSNPHAQPSLRFLVRLDSVEVWRSEPITLENQSSDFSVPVTGAQVLEIAVERSTNSSGITHAVWFDLSLQ
jgi:dolichyl-phosphate-mannose-protein mannosyltransferase